MKTHNSSLTHVTGSSEFVADRHLLRNEVFIDILYSSKAHAKIVELDYSKVLSSSLIITVITAKDLKHNAWGTIFQDQPILADQIVNFAGEPIAIIVGETLLAAQQAKEHFHIRYEELDPILSIDKAISNKSFIGDKRVIENGDVTNIFKNSTNIIKNSLTIKGHDHFYFEPQSSIVYPLENNQFEIHTSSQHPTETQHVVAHTLGIPSKDITCIVNRLGGAFGGKESQAAPFAAMAAIVAQKLNRPARIILTKEDDMTITGKRNPFKNYYKVAFENSGKITALKIDLFSDAGAYADLSTSIMERAMLHSDNAYNIENIKITGQVCKTNYHPHTAFRGFGAPKGVATIEIIIEQIAHLLSLDPVEVRQINLYSTNNITPYGQIFKNNCLPKLFKNILAKSDYHKRKQSIYKFNNSQNQFIKGISIMPVKFGISFTTRFLNQGNALVIIHQDGSLQISTGATEMGQGVHTKIGMIVCDELGINTNQVRVMPTRTDKNANTSPTAASSGTDINGAAALKATKKIKERLSKLASKLLAKDKSKWAYKTAGLGSEPEISIDFNYNDEIIFKDGLVFSRNAPKKTITFKELITEAYLNRISLSDYAHYKIPGIEFNKLTGKGDAFLYFTQGIACSEVIIDKDTGEIKVSRTDIIMDLGSSLHQDIDKGQISGAFVQGMGWLTTENLFYNEQGLLLSNAPSNYKIPSIQDIPREFNIELLTNNENYVGLKGSKAVGEPPLLLALSIWTAIHNALTNLTKYKAKFPNLKIPANNEEILRAIHVDKFKYWDNK